MIMVINASTYSENELDRLTARPPYSSPPYRVYLAQARPISNRASEL